MKQLLQNLGLIIFILAVGLLIYSMFLTLTSNILLIVSGALMILGLLVHVIMNKTFE
jgi:hypothetical protein